jgi:hypothetical protein
MFYSAADLGQALTAIAAAADQSITIPASGTGVVVPSSTPKLAGAFAVMEPATALQVQLQAPSLRTRTYPSIEPFTLDASVPSATNPVMWWGDNPTDLEPSETLQVFVDSDEAVAQYVGVLLADGPVKPVTGKIQSLRFTGSITSTAANWVSGTVTFDQQLPSGRYRVVGMRIKGTGLVAGRLIFDDQTARPGVPAALLSGGLDAKYARLGASGGWGDFDSTNPPKLEVIGGTASAQVGFLDLIKI